MKTRQVNARAEELLKSALVCDMTLPWEGSYSDEDITLPKFKSAHVDFISLTVAARGNDMHSTVESIARITAHIRERSEQMILVDTVEDILAAKHAGKLALGFNLQETLPFEENIAFVDVFYRLGVRHALLAYNLRNLVGDGCAERTDAGLSRFGIDLVREMNRVGMIVDGTHSGYRTTMEAMEVCSSPFIFSHSNAHAVWPHYRNIRDDQIKACAKSAGVVGINGLGTFLGEGESLAELIFAHIDYISTLVGPEHVGIGLDYVRDAKAFSDWVEINPNMWPSSKDGEAPIGSEFAQPEVLANVVALMLERQYSEGNIRDILGGNFLRVARQVWKPSPDQASGARENAPMNVGLS